MPRRYFNWKLAIVLVIGLVVLGVTAFGLREWRRSNRSELGLRLGNKAYDEHRYGEAASQLGRYLAVERDVPILLKYADAHLNIRPLKSNNVQQAIAAYQTVLREDKNNSDAAVKLTEIYLGSKGMAGEAELIAARFLETNQNLKIRRLLAIALARQGKFSDAEKELKNIIAQHPDQILAYETLGQLTEQRPQDFPDSASRLFNEAVKNNPSSALALLIRTAFHLRNEEKVEALADLKRAKKLDLSDPNIQLRLSVEFVNANIFDDAEKYLEAVQAADPDNQLLWQTWSRLALKSKSKAMMLKVAETGLNELSFQPWDFMPTAAELYIRCDELDRAGDCIAKLSQRGIAPPITAFLDGLLDDKEGRLFEAAKSFRLAIQKGNTSPRVRLALASTLSRSGNQLSALRQLRTLVSERPTLFDGRLALARLLARMGSWTETAKQAGMARGISPNSLDAALLYFQARMQLLAASTTSEDARMWQDIEDRLAPLEKASENAFPVKASQFQLALFRSQFNKAQQLLNDMKNTHPSRRELAMAEVKLLIAQEKNDEAIAKLYDVVSVFPEYISPVRYLAILLAAKNKNKDCESIIKDALARIEQSVAKRDLGLLLADFYERWKEQEKRYEFLNSFAHDLPEDILVKCGLLTCEKVIKDFDRAQQLVNKIKTIEGEQGWQWRYQQAGIWFAQDNFKNRYPRIISILKENLLAYPDDQNSRMLLARSYERAGQLPLAISTYRQALDRSPGDLNIIVRTVEALRNAKEYERADEILRRVDSEKLSHPELKKYRLQRCLVRGELDSAIDILEDLLADDPNNRADTLSLAMLKMRQNKFAEADELLIRLKIQEPNSLQVKVARIELNVRQGKSVEALLLCDEIVNNLKNASAYIIRARTYVMLEQPNKAIEDFEHATATEPNNVGAWVAKSDFHCSVDQQENAIADIRKALSVAPDNLRVQKLAISLLLPSNRPDRVLQRRTILDKALMANPEDFELGLYQAHSLIAEGTAPAFKSAEQILKKITKGQPEFSPAWVLWAELSLKQEEYGEAVDTVLRGLANKPNDRGLILLKARAEAQRSPALAIPTLKLLHETDPNDTDTALLLAGTYIEAEETREAVNLLREQLASCSSAADERKVKIALVRALYKNGDKTEFQKEFDSLLQSAPDDSGPLLALVLLLRDEKLWNEINRKTADWCRDHPEDTLTPLTIAGRLVTTEGSQAKKVAEELLRGVLADDHNSLPAMNTLALLLQLTDRPAESAEMYRQVLTIQPDNTKAMNNLAWILCEDQGKHKEALELTQRGLKILPNYIDLIDTCGVVNYRLGLFEKAVQNFNTCLQLYPKGTLAATTTYFHLGRALTRMGQKDGAMINLNKALELNTEIGGLSTEDADETRRMIDQLSLGG